MNGTDISSIIRTSLVIVIRSSLFIFQAKWNLLKFQSPEIQMCYCPPRKDSPASINVFLPAPQETLYSEPPINIKSETKSPRQED